MRENSFQKERIQKMARFANVIIFKKEDAIIEDRINQIRQVVATLERNNLKRLSDTLQSLGELVHELEHLIYMKVKAQIEVEAERKVNAMLKAGFNFNEVTVDKVHFILNDTGEIQRYDILRMDEDFPF